MNFLEEKIISDGVIKEGNILKVDNFLNHQIDIVKQAGADVVGLGVALEKGQQPRHPSGPGPRPDPCPAW